MTGSKTLENIILSRNGLTNVQVVSVDIVKFSLRKTRTQRAILEIFTNLTKKALAAFSLQYKDFALSNQINFSTDLIKIPTGDGFLLAMPLEGLPKPHLDFSIELLKGISEYNKSNQCPIYNENGWCNCHPNFDVRIGIDEGQSLIFKDLNDNYNIIGNTINMTSRIMDLADEKTILLGETTYKNLIDVADLGDEEFNFVDHGKIRVKNELYIGVYQYCPKDTEYISNNKPKKIQDYQFEKEEKEKVIRIEKIYTDAFKTSGSLNQTLESNLPSVENKISAFDLAALAFPIPALSVLFAKELIKRLSEKPVKNFENSQ